MGCCKGPPRGSERCSNGLRVQFTLRVPNIVEGCGFTGLQRSQTPRNSRAEPIFFRTKTTGTMFKGRRRKPLNSKAPSPQPVTPYPTIPAPLGQYSLHGPSSVNSRALYCTYVGDKLLYKHMHIQSNTHRCMQRQRGQTGSLKSSRPVTAPT